MDETEIDKIKMKATTSIPKERTKQRQDDNDQTGAIGQEREGDRVGGTSRGDGWEVRKANDEDRSKGCTG